jgi:isopentenyl-diphosphate delta-isomerase
VTEPIVELVDLAGNTVGRSGKAAAHKAPGQLHRTFSVFLLDGSGRVLIQRRSVTKYHSGGLWSNTCCGHPQPGEQPADAAARRIADELGLQVEPRDLVAVGTVTYRIADPVSGLSEHEYDHLFVGRTAGKVAPNPNEVAEVVYLSLEELTPTRLRTGGFTAWLPIVLREAMPALLFARTTSQASVRVHSAAVVEWTPEMGVGRAGEHAQHRWWGVRRGRKLRRDRLT